MADPRRRDDIAADYQAARGAGHDAAMARFQNEEACFVLLSILERLASDPSSFAHRVALKGGVLMAGELRSPRASADIDMTTGAQKRIDPNLIVADLQGAGRSFNLRPDGDPERTKGGVVIHLRFDSLTNRGTAKVEVSVREDLVFAVRDALINVSDLGIEPFSLPALAEVELVAEKLRALAQRSQPRDLFDLRLYLVDSGWHLDPVELRTAADRKFELTRLGRWRPRAWRAHLAEIEPLYELTLLEWVAPEQLPPFATAVADVERRLKALRLD